MQKLLAGSIKDAVIVLGHTTGKVKNTGRTFDNDWRFDFKMRDGLYPYNAYVNTLYQAKPSQPVFK